MVNRSVVHFEIPTADSHSTAEFYKHLFGWEYRHLTEPYPYTMFYIQEGSGGGFTNLDERTKPGDILIYIGSDDIEADLKKAEQLGGKVVTAKMLIPGAGWMGVFSDPTGNRIALWKDDPNAT